MTSNPGPLKHGRNVKYLFFGKGIREGLGERWREREGEKEREKKRCVVRKGA